MATQTPPRRSELGTGAVAGVLAFAAGYVVTYAWQSGAVADALAGYNVVADLLGGDPIPTWQGVGWLFYNAHGVAFTHPALGGGRVTRNFIAGGDAPTALYLVPAVLLAAAGFAVARAADARAAATGATAGARVLPGYLVCALVGLAAFRYSANGAVVHVRYLPGVLLAGVVYPVAFGALGGALRGATR